MISDRAKQFLALEIGRRDAIHRDNPNRLALSDDFELVGLLGEIKLGDRWGLPVNFRQRHGEPDFIILIATSGDLKCFHNPENLLVKEGTAKHAIYILGGCSDDYEIDFLGWEHGSVVRNAPVSDRFAGVPNHYIAAGKLRKMEELDPRVMRLVAGQTNVVPFPRR